jgi:hypothetical protein
VVNAERANTEVDQMDGDYMMHRALGIASTEDGQALIDGSVVPIC